MNHSGSQAAGNVAMGIGYAIALIPIGLATLLWLMASAFYQPLFDERITVLAVSPAVAFLVALAVLAAIGALVVRHVRQAALVGLARFVTTSAGLFLVVLAPAILLILIDLGDWHRLTPARSGRRLRLASSLACQAGPCGGRGRAFVVTGPVLVGVAPADARPVPAASASRRPVHPVAGRIGRLAQPSVQGARARSAWQPPRAAARRQDPLEAVHPGRAARRTTRRGTSPRRPSG